MTITLAAEQSSGTGDATAKSWWPPYFVLLGKAPAISLDSTVLLLNVGFDLLVLRPLLFSPGHYIISCHSVGQNSTSFKINPRGTRIKNKAFTF